VESVLLRHVLFPPGVPSWRTLEPGGDMGVTVWEPPFLGVGADPY
jgi:hypothetical protein